MNKSDVQSLGERVGAAMRADPKKTAILASLVVVLGVFWFRAIGGAAGPNKAAAVVAGGASPVATLAPVVPANPAYRALCDWAKGPIQPVSRNLFYINYEAFPLDGSATRKPELSAKSAPSASEDQNRREKVQAFKKDAEDLRLQSILLGPEPKALVDGRLIREGDVVASFRVQKIGARSLVIEREGIRLEVKLK